MPTFPIDTTVPPVAAIGLDDPTDTIGGVDVTPGDWPSSGKATAFEVDVTVTEEHAFDGQVGVFVSEHDTVAGIPGDWSGTPGTVGGWGSNNTVTGWRWDKFGGWRTDYLTFGTDASSAGQCSIAGSIPATTTVDVRVRCRRADWDGFVDASLEQVLVAREDPAGGITGPWLLLRHKSPGADPGTLLFTYFKGPGTHTVTCSNDDLGVVDGEWIWFRAQTSTTANTVISVSADGANWTPVTPTTVSGTPGAIRVDIAPSINVGAISQTRSGFGGDISDVEVYGSGDLLATLALDGMESPTDLSWPTPEGNTVTRGTDIGVTGTTIPAQATARFEFADPTPMDEWRLFVDCDDGEITLDEVRLEVQRRGGRHLGLVRGSRGVG